MQSLTFVLLAIASSHFFQCGCSDSCGGWGKPAVGVPGKPDRTALLQNLASRPRRNRRSPTIRSAIQEHHLSPSNMILPMFVHEKDKNEPIPSMPGVNRLSYDNGVIDFVSEARSYGVNQVVIFPKACLRLSQLLRPTRIHQLRHWKHHTCHPCTSLGAASSGLYQTFPCCRRSDSSPCTAMLPLWAHQSPSTALKAGRVMCGCCADPRRAEDAHW